MATDRVKYWTEIADYDLGTAETCTKAEDGFTLPLCAIKRLKRR
jgi:hypothetical protein